MAASLLSWGTNTAAHGLFAAPSLSKRAHRDAAVSAMGVAGWVKPASEFARTLRKDRLPSGLRALDMLLDGGLARGKISEVIGRHGAGKTSLAACFTATAVRRGEIAAWIDSSDAFDPASLQQAGVILSRVLWVNPGAAGYASDAGAAFCRRLGPAESPRNDAVMQSADYFDLPRAERSVLSLGHDAYPSAFALRQWRAAEMVLKVGGFGLLVLDLGSFSGMISRVAALRLARAAEQSATAVLILARHRVCGSFAALTVGLKSSPRFSRLSADAPILFEGLRVEARLARNKLGAAGRAAMWSVLAGRPARPASSLLASWPSAPARAAAR